MSTDLHALAAERLLKTEQRYTRNRRAIVDTLDQSEHPLTIADLLQQSPGLAQSSAYRNLVVLEEAGVVTRIITSDDYARFELSEDLTGHHHHLICSICGSVQDFTLSPQIEHSLTAAFRRVGRARNFRIGHHQLDLVGLCGNCPAD